MAAYGAYPFGVRLQLDERVLRALLGKKPATLTDLFIGVEVGEISGARRQHSDAQNRSASPVFRKTVKFEKAVGQVQTITVKDRKAFEKEKAFWLDRFAPAGAGR